MVHKMNFISQNSAPPGVTTSIVSELNSIGCEAWIDINRFCATEKSLQHTARTSSNSSLTKSFTDLRRKFRKGSE